MDNTTSRITAIVIIMLVRSLAAVKTDLSAREASVKISMNAKKGLDNCHKNADCLNTKDGFECKCESVYMGDGIDWYDADEWLVITTAEKCAVC